MKLILTGFILIAFLLGLFLSSLFIDYSKPFVRLPDSFAPSDYINENQIHIYQDSVCIDVNDSYIISYSNTSSMIPLLNENANGIGIKVTNESQLHIGDIATYKYDPCPDINRSEVGVAGYYDNRTNKTIYPCEIMNIAHRIVGIENDSNGTYYLVLDNTLSLVTQTVNIQANATYFTP